MKKILFLSVLAGGMALNAQAQFQVENSDFEGEIIHRKYDRGFILGTVEGDEPYNWSSFLSATGGMKQMGVIKNQAFIETADLPDNGSGSFQCVKITDNEVKIGGKSIFAQGNLTTGCINMGDSNPGNAAKNYNYTKLGTDVTDPNNEFDSDYQRQPFTGHPDAMKVWVKYHSSDNTHRAKANTVLHTDGYYQDPEANTIDAQVVGMAETKAIEPNDKWTELIIPFDYKGTGYLGKGSAYALVSFSTNATPGVGTGESYMLIDDLSYVYNSELVKATYNGQSLTIPANNGTTQCTDLIYDQKKLVLESNGHAATIRQSYNSNTALLTVIVQGENVKEDKTNRHVYKFQFKKVTGELGTLSVNDQPIQLASGQSAYKFMGEYTKGCVKAVTAEDVVTYTESYDPNTRICTINTNFADDPSFNKTYTIKFYKEAPQFSSKLVIVGDVDTQNQNTVVGYMQAPVQPVEITAPLNGKVDLHLMNFVFAGIPVGDIFVNDVTCTDNGDGTYAISKEDLTFKIYGDAASAINEGITKLSLNGNITKKGANWNESELSARIQITWAGKPIIVNVAPTNTTSINLAGESIKAVKLDEVRQGLTNPNAIIYADADATGAAANDVVNGTCANLTIADGVAFNAPVAFKATAVNFDRQFNITGNYVSSFVLPFAVDKKNVNGKVYKFASVNGTYVNFTEVTNGTLEANTPYLIEAAAANPFTLANVQVAATPAEMAVKVGNYAHVGSYTTQQVTSDNTTSYYGYKGGNFVKANTGTLKPFRTMIKATGVTAAPAQFSLKLGNEVTGIIGVNSEIGKVNVYNLEGKLVRCQVEAATALQGLEKGVYVINGQKVIK